MKTKTILCRVGAVAAVVCAGFFPALSQDEKPASQPSAEEMEKIMAAYAEFIKPGPEHEAFKKFVGEWTVDSKMYMAPGAPPVESKADATFEVILGGRYLVQRYHSDAEEWGGDYQGMGITAYDKATKQFVNSWMDSMGTGMMVSRGKNNQDGDMELFSEPVYDPLKDKKVKFRMLRKIVDDDHVNFKMFALSEDGQGEAIVMDIDYRRKK